MGASSGEPKGKKAKAKATGKMKSRGVKKKPPPGKKKKTARAVKRAARL